MISSNYFSVVLETFVTGNHLEGSDKTSFDKNIFDILTGQEFQSDHIDVYHSQQIPLHYLR